MIKLLVTFILFAGVVYYFNVDIMGLVERSGAPKWLEDHGYRVKHEPAASTTVNTSAAIKP